MVSTYVHMCELVDIDTNEIRSHFMRNPLTYTVYTGRDGFGTIHVKVGFITLQNIPMCVNLLNLKIQRGHINRDAMCCF